jgi:hypothetical protein
MDFIINFLGNQWKRVDVEDFDSDPIEGCEWNHLVYKEKKLLGLLSAQM